MVAPPARFRSILAASLGLALAACAARTPQVAVAPPGAAGGAQSRERLLWSSGPRRPVWTLGEPEADPAFREVVAVSEDSRTEALARADALRSAAELALRGIGAGVRELFEATARRLGLPVAAVDPAGASREFVEGLSTELGAQLKPVGWYLEQWQRQTGYRFRAFVRARVATPWVDERLRRAAEEHVQRAQRRVAEATTEAERREAEGAAAFWRRVRAEGLSP